MNDILVSVAVFHTLSSFTLMMGCAVNSVARTPRRVTGQVWIDQMEVDADALLSAPVAAASVLTPVAAERATAAVA